MLNHTMKFETIKDMLEWIVENNYYTAAPVTLTVDLTPNNMRDCLDCEDRTPHINNKCFICGSGN